MPEAPSPTEYWHGDDNRQHDTHLLPARPQQAMKVLVLSECPKETPHWPLLQCAAPGRSSQCGTRSFPGLTRQPRNTLLVPPGVCGSWPLLAAWDPRFPGLTANPQRKLGPSCSVRLLAAPRSVGPALFLGSPPTCNTRLVPPGVCGSWPLLAVWDPRFSSPRNGNVGNVWRPR